MTTTCVSPWAASPRLCRARTRSHPNGTRPRSAESKRTIAAQLFRRLKQRYAPHGLAHFGQGKWYPGEPLPRWSFNCFWRRDGETIWNDASLVADEACEYAGATGNASRLLLEVASAAGHRREACVRGVRRRTLLSVARAQAPGQCRSIERHAHRSRRARKAGADPRPNPRSSRRISCCRLPRVPRVLPGEAGPGFCAVSAATCCRATRRWAFGCRSIRCHG